MNKLSWGAKKSLIAMSCLLVGFQVFAENLSLKTSLEDVNGVREIEAGDYQSGITKTKASLEKVTVTSLQAPLLNNLCVAYIADGQLQQAKKACDKAIVAGKRNAIAYNNHAVLDCITNNAQACLENLEMAQSLSKSNRLIEKNLQFVKETQMLAKN